MHISIVRFSLVLAMATLFTVALTETNAPNIQFVSQGYNIFKGNPMPQTDDGIDPGFADIIFHLQAPTPSDTSDDFAEQEYTQPVNTTIIIGESCQIASSAQELNSVIGYNDALSAQASVDIGFIIGSFSASATYKSVSSYLSEQGSSAYLMNGSCTIYSVKVERPLALSKSFIQDVLELDPDDSASYFSFFETYGTHYVTDIDMGAKISMLSTFSSSNLQQVTSQGISIQAAAKASFDLSFGLSGSYSTDDTDAEKFSSYSSYSEITTIGSAPNQNIQTWAESITNPLPISYTLTSIQNAITPQNFNATYTQRVQRIANNFPQAFVAYCNNLKGQGLLDSCPGDSDENDDVAIPSSSGSQSPVTVVTGGSEDIIIPTDCYLLDSTCGTSEGWAGYSVFGGIMQNDYLCCTPDQQGTSPIDGTIRLCKSCGGDFPYEIVQLNCAENTCENTEIFGSLCSGQNPVALVGTSLYACSSTYTNNCAFGGYTSCGGKIQRGYVEDWTATGVKIDSNSGEGFYPGTLSLCCNV